jgi:hypothetical protein
MHWPLPGNMLERERERYPQLEVKPSKVKGERVGLGVFATRRLEPGEFICCVLATCGRRS